MRGRIRKKRPRVILKYGSHIKLSNINKEWIDNLSKTINENGCWIPNRWSPLSSGYIPVQIEKIVFLLHRLSLCVYNNLNYNDDFETRHNTGCDKACFNPEHLKSGTVLDNMQDRTKDGTHYETRKKVCSKCGGEYKTRIIKSGYQKGETKRYCPICSNNWNKGI